MKKHTNAIGVLAFALILGVPALSRADTGSQPADSNDGNSATSVQDQLFTNAGGFLATASYDVPNGTGGTSSTSVSMLGGGGSYNLDRLFPYGQYFNVMGSFMGGTASSSLSFGGIGIGAGAHVEFEPTAGNVDLGAISAFADVLENYTSLYISMPTYTIGNQTYGGNQTYSSSNASIEYGVKWVILNAYEWDFYGVNGSSSSSSGQSAPVGGNSLNLNFKWLLEPKRESYYLGAGYQRQSQNGVTTNFFMLLGGYVW